MALIGRIAKVVVLASVFVMIINAGVLSAEEGYHFERMWPGLEEAWYFNRPEGIAIDTNGNVYVADTANNQVQKFTSDGKVIASFGSKGRGDGQFDSPEGIAVDASGNVYVADTGNDRIQKFSSTGEFIAKWGSHGGSDSQFNSPKGIAVDASGNVYVADTWNYRIQKFSSSGQFIAKWGSKGKDDGQFAYPGGIAVDASGNVYVADTYNNRIQKFSSTGEFISKWGSNGKDDGQFDRPEGIAVDASGNVYVTDYGNDRIQKFSMSGQFITKWGSIGSGDGQFDRPAGIAVDASGNVYVADTYNNRIQKFSSTGEFIAKWGSKGSGDGQFNSPNGIVVDASGNVYVADNGNHRIQKFTSDGKFIAKWGSKGRGDGLLSFPEGIAVDSSGNIYVADSGNNRIQKFTSDGKFIAKWGSNGDGDGQFDSPEGIAVDASGNVYVADTGNHLIQKFSSTGEFIAKWGSKGDGDRLFAYPEGIAVDTSGNVYVADTYNNRIQKLSSTGEFIAEWGSKGSDDGQFKLPEGIAVDSSGNVYVADTDNHRIQKFSTNGEYIEKFGQGGSSLGQLSYPRNISISATGKVYVADTDNNRIQVFSRDSTQTSSILNKAIIVAGSGPEVRPNLWDEILVNVNHAYGALTVQGFTSETINYLSHDAYLDRDKDGNNDIDAITTNANLQKAITEWAIGSNDVVVYLIGHGDNGNFTMGPGGETLKSTELASWLDTLQSSLTGKITLIYDTCYSGEFMGSVKQATSSKEIIMTSTSSGEKAYFENKGVTSFSYIFWSGISDGETVYESFKRATESIPKSWKQTPLIEANGNAVANEMEDQSIAESFTIGNGVKHAASLPEIGNVTASLTTGTSGLIQATGVTTSGSIQRVWAVILPPDFTPDSTSAPITNLPKLDLTSTGSGSYEGTYTGFTSNGEYSITVYVTDGNNNVGLPRSTILTQSSGASSSPVLTIKANGETGTMSMKTTDTLKLGVSLLAGGLAGTNADWWLYANTDIGNYYYDVNGGSWSWKPGRFVTYQGQLADIAETNVLIYTGLPVGSYTFYFKVDTTMNGLLDGQPYSDTVTVDVSQ